MHCGHASAATHIGPSTCINVLVNLTQKCWTDRGANRNSPEPRTMWQRTRLDVFPLAQDEAASGAGLAAAEERRSKHRTQAQSLRTLKTAKLHAAPESSN